MWLLFTQAAKQFKPDLAFTERDNRSPTLIPNLEGAWAAAGRSRHKMSMEDIAVKI
jgi:hypothetical protein